MKNTTPNPSTQKALLEQIHALAERVASLEQAQAALRAELEDVEETTETYRILLDESSDPIFAFYADGTYRYVNRAFAEGVQRRLDEITGHRIWDVFPQDEADKRFAVVHWVFTHGKVREIEVRVPRTDGDRFYLTTVKPILNERGEVTSVICISKEITERKRMEEELRRLSISDTLSGVYNRSFFEAEIQRLEHSRLYPVTIIMSDLDNLKQINDKRGHAAGDDVIRGTGAVLRQSFRKEDIIARYGGDEFVVLMPETDADAALGAVARLRENALNAPQGPIGLSIGWATGEQDIPLYELLRLADDRMYQDKAVRGGVDRDAIH